MVCLGGCHSSHFLEDIITAELRMLLLLRLLIVVSVQPA